MWTPSPGAIGDLPTSAEPTTSVIIPVFNHWEATERCLRAVSQLSATTPFEVIVVDDGSSDETQARASELTGLRYLRRAQNGGFIAACSDGAAQARGDILIFLNNDTVPQPGWLDALTGALLSEGAGLVGAQLVNADGSLQEAGGIVYADASAANYGRSESPDDPRFAFVREADYCSGAAIAVDRSLFEKAGGFDRRYSPAYYEDTDLAFAIRRLGARVVYEPRARVLHDEGTSSGTDVTQGVKAYQERNRWVFRDKWEAVLPDQPAPGADPTTAALHRRSEKVLVVDHSLPRPDRDSGSLRLLNLVKMLRAEEAHVVFWPADRAYSEAIVDELRGLGVEVWHAPYAPRFSTWVRLNGSRFTTVMACRFPVAAQALPLVRRWAPNARFVFDTVDLHHLREARRAEISGDAELAATAESIRRRELDLVARSDVTLVVSHVEADILHAEVPGASIEVLSNIHTLSGPGLEYVERKDVVFVGGFSHAPNLDAVIWFLDSVWPRINERLPDVTFHCIGSDPPAELRQRASTPGVRVHGFVENLEPYMNGARVCVAPLRSGAGVKGKVNMSMAHGQPVVATQTAVEGMFLEDGVDVLVADSAHDFANAVVKVYEDETLWRTLAAGGLRNVEEHFSTTANLDVARRVLLRQEG